MKKQLKTKEKRVTIAAYVFGAIKSKRLAEKATKDCAFLVADVKKHYPGTKFSLAHLAWYLSRYRKQDGQGLGMERLHKLLPIKKKSHKTGAKKTSSKTGKKASKKTRVEVDETVTA